MLLRAGGAARRAALAATSRGLVSASKQPLPTMETIRSLSKPELEGVRLQLDRQLDGCPAQADRGAIQRLLGATLLRLGSPLDAELVLDEALSDHEGDERAEEAVDTRFMLGVAYQKSGRAKEALDAFDWVLEATDGEHWRAKFHLALLSISEGYHDEAEALLEQVVEAEPGHVDSVAILEKLVERRRAEANELEVPDPDGAVGPSKSSA